MHPGEPSHGQFQPLHGPFLPGPVEFRADLFDQRFRNGQFVHEVIIPNYTAANCTRAPSRRWASSLATWRAQLVAQLGVAIAKIAELPGVDQDQVGLLGRRAETGVLVRLDEGGKSQQIAAHQRVDRAHFAIAQQVLDIHFAADNEAQVLDGLSLGKQLGAGWDACFSSAVMASSPQTGLVDAGKVRITAKDFGRNHVDRAPASSGWGR